MRLTIDCKALAAAAKDGESICVSGACLTVSSAEDDRLRFDVVPETLGRSNLGSLQKGQRVNLEPSLRVGDLLGGHFVYGHVDAVSTIESKAAEGPGYRIRCSIPPGLDAMIVEKGFVALDGVSLTVARAENGAFEVALIPETLERTTLGEKGTGAGLNVEVDPIARYVANIIERRK